MRKLIFVALAGLALPAAAANAADQHADYKRPNLVQTRDDWQSCLQGADSVYTENNGVVTAADALAFAFRACQGEALQMFKASIDVSPAAAQDTNQFYNEFRAHVTDWAQKQPVQKLVRPEQPAQKATQEPVAQEPAAQEQPAPNALVQTLSFMRDVIRLRDEHINKLRAERDEFTARARQDQAVFERRMNQLDLR